jgi:hypothetical protein
LPISSWYDCGGLRRVKSPRVNAVWILLVFDMACGTVFQPLS